MDWSEGKELFKSLYQAVFEKNAKQSWVQVWVMAEKLWSFQYIKIALFFSIRNPTEIVNSESIVKYLEFFSFLADDYALK